MIPEPPLPGQSPRGRRRYGRLRLRIAARLITIQETAHGVLLDVSLDGARLRMREPVERRGDAIIQWPGHEAFGRIVWSQGCECGIRFDEALSEPALLALRDTMAFPDEREQVRTAAAAFVNGRPGFSGDARPKVAFGKR